MVLTKYYELARRIQESQGTAKAEALIAQAEDLEDVILAQYGLPPSRRFVRILRSIHRHKKLSEQVLAKVRAHLEEAASDNSELDADPDQFEVARQADTFGNIAQLFSTYESRRRPDDPKPFARGINSIQLMNDGKRWWVVSVYWQAERPDNPIPARYLPKP